MRFARLFVPCALSFLVLSAPALAADAQVTVGDNFFNPSNVRIEPGDQVTWQWSGAALHNVKSDPGQSESFQSALMQGSGNTFQHTFPDAGRFTYICEVHPIQMKGVVQVGEPDTVDPRATRLKAKPGDRRVKLSFRLSEESRVKLSLRGPTRKSTTKRFDSGKRSVTFRRLAPGRYKATVRPTDLAGNRGGAVTKRFRVSA